MSPATTSRYETLVKIASGGMATVFVGHVSGSRKQLVAIKRPHPHLLDDEDFRRSLLAEAHLASQIKHANVVSVRDVELREDSVHLVMDYVEGLSLAELLTPTTPNVVSREELARVALRILLDACAGLHAAHELSDDQKRPLGLVHRDVSPHNILVGVDGVGRVVDFGIAKCILQRDGHSTTTGTVKGKTAYMAPEYMAGRAIDRRSDIFAMGVLLWEVLAAERLFRGKNDAETIARVLGFTPPPISTVAPFCGTRFDTIIGRALAKDPSFRHATMLVLADAIDGAARGTTLIGTHRDVAQLIQKLAGERLASRRDRVRTMLDRVPNLDDDEGEDNDQTVAATLMFERAEPRTEPNRPKDPEANGFDDSRPHAGTIPLGAVYDEEVAPPTHLDTRPPAFTPALASTAPLGAQSPHRPAPFAGTVVTPRGSSPRVHDSSRVVTGSTPSARAVSARTDVSQFGAIPQSTPTPSRKSNAPLFIGLGALALVVVAVVVASSATKKPTEAAAVLPSTSPIAESSSALAASASASTTEPAAESPAVVASATQESSADPASSLAAPRSSAARVRPNKPAPVASHAAASGASAPSAPPAPPPASADTPRPLPTNPYHR